MSTDWAVAEMESAELNDRRLNERLTTLLAALGEHPTASIPAACGGFNETTAAYRFFNNEKVTFDSVLAPHFDRTRQRMAEHSTVLLVQDTTELEFTRPVQQMVGAGPLDHPGRWGAYLHPLIAFTPDGTPLGACWATAWARAELAHESPAAKRSRRQATPIEQKESRRWLDGLRQARDAAQQVPAVHCICVADSEADIYELFAEPRGVHPVDWLIRACHDRAVLPTNEAEDEASHLRSVVESQPVLFTQEVFVRGREATFEGEMRARRQPRESRTALLEVRVTAVSLRGPYRPGGRLPSVMVNVVQAREVHPPPDDVPVEWLLLTTLSIDTADQVRQTLANYTVRYLIEVLFRVLKSGCRVEERRFERLERMLPCVALYLIVAWRTLMVCRLARSHPDLNCEALFDPAEWKSVWMVTYKRRPPRRPPRLAEFLPLVAQLGGYVNAPGRLDPPGPQTTWLGLQRLHDLALAWNTFGPGNPARAKKKLV